MNKYKYESIDINNNSKIIKMNDYYSQVTNPEATVEQSTLQSK